MGSKPVAVPHRYEVPKTNPDKDLKTNHRIQTNGSFQWSVAASTDEDPIVWDTYESLRQIVPWKIEDLYVRLSRRQRYRHRRERFFETEFYVHLVPFIGIDGSHPRPFFMRLFHLEESRLASKNPRGDASWT